MPGRRSAQFALTPTWPGANISGSYTPDLSTGLLKFYTLTGDVTINNPINAPGSGRELVMAFTQDSTGGHKVTFAGNWFWGPFNGVARTANATTIVRFVQSQNGWLCVDVQTTENAPWWQQIIPFLSGTDGDKTQGTWSTVQDSGAIFGGYMYNASGAAINDEIGWNVQMGAGTYNFVVAYRHGTSGSQWGLFLDGTQVGATVDSYAASGANNFYQTYTGVVVNNSGKHRLSIKTLGKNASSTNYWTMIHAIQARRTS